MNGYTLNIQGRLLDLSHPILMGILNTTPDSFYKDSRVSNIEDALIQAGKMIENGATILDIGGYSSRPGADHISESEEIERVCPIIKSIHQKFPEVFLSIDTFRSTVAKQAVKSGAHIINDISGGEADAAMFQTVKELNVPYILMHMKGTPQTMQSNPSYKNIVQDVYTSLMKRLLTLRKLGVKDVIVDLGFGFGKTIDHNYNLLKNLEYFHTLNCPILVGVSRKSMIYKPLEISPSESLNASTVLHTIATQKGAQILRVHDTKEAKEVIDIYSLMNRT